jgi:DNA-binding IclR family transcriptional regulator
MRSSLASESDGDPQVLDKNIARSATRALDVLTYFAHVQQPARASSIADALQMPRSSTDQLLKTLVNAGYLVFFSENKTYFPSPRLHVVGDWLAKTYSREAGLSDLLDALHEETGQVVTLTMQNDCHMQIVECAGADAVAELPPAAPAYRFPLIGTAVGGALLVSKNHKEVQRIVSRARRSRAAAFGQRDFSELPERLISYRSAGYAWARRPLPNTTERGPKGEMMSLAMPVPGRITRVPMVLGMAGPARRIMSSERDFVFAMKSRLQSYVAHADRATH